MKPRRFVVGDIHGCARTFRRLVTEVIRLRPGDELYLLGDLLDRGPDSKGVLDFIFELRAQGYFVMSVRGNHEEMCLQAGNDLSYLELWLANGGLATLNSFAAEAPGEIPHKYRFFLSCLPYYLLLDDFVIVHAALNFDRADPFEDQETMIWQRECSVDCSRIGGRRIINGHTAISRSRLEASLGSDRIMLDNGCVFVGRAGLGSLAALELNTMTISYQANIDIDVG
ncbi:MAG: serine/threonine protein phosphatase [Geobacter sp.]|nr:MAG: serine/threonine protein phosphatase [Geobacter sp.]